MQYSAVELFTPEASELIRQEISENDGRETAFIGFLNRDGKVADFEVMSYGNDSSAPFLTYSALNGDVVVHNHPSGNLQASTADVEVASLLGNQRIGFYIINNECDQVSVFVQPFPRAYLDEGDIEEIFHPGGLLSKTIPNFESRDEQCGLVSSIVDSMNGSSLLLSEAGTGTGKSLSYLIPAAVWAVENHKPVLVSTHTINLQQQIAGKDMQIVRNVVNHYLDGEEVKFAVLMGKANYICKRKLYTLLRDKETQSTLFSEDDDADILIQIENWVRVNAQEGTKSEFAEPVKSALWEEINCDSLYCIRRKCSFYSDCFYYKARLKAEGSNIIIANHSLVFSTIDDASLRSMLPYFAGIVFDEAHHLEDTALKSRSKDFSFQGILYHLRKLYSVKKSKSKGMLPLLEAKTGFRGYPEVVEMYQNLTDNIKMMISQTYQANLNAEELLKSPGGDNATIAIDEAFMRSKAFDTLNEVLTGLFSTLLNYMRDFERFSEKLKLVSANPETPMLIKSVQIRNSYLMEAFDVFKEIFNTEVAPESVRWIEVTKRNIRFAKSPLEIGDFIANSLFNKKDFTILTSATLMINQKFDYFKRTTGIYLAGEKQINELVVSSPFDYQNQAEVLILNQELRHSAHTKEKTDLVYRACLASEGGALVLFTSYARLIEMFEELKDKLMENGLFPMRQGQQERSELLRIMNSRSYSVLFATSSFWEGIDVQGENLRTVIIEKLPFDNPSGPLYRAKTQLLEARGMNSFVSYSIPRAILRLKQGVGRLIRSKRDRGVIILMDNRVKTKQYGRQFLNALPPAPQFYLPPKELIKKVEDFFTER